MRFLAHIIHHRSNCFHGPSNNRQRLRFLLLLQRWSMWQRQKSQSSKKLAIDFKSQKTCMFPFLNRSKSNNGLMKYLIKNYSCMFFMRVFLFNRINRLALLSLMSSFQETIAIFFCLMIHCQIDRFLFLLLEKKFLLKFDDFSFVSRVCDLCQTD